MGGAKADNSARLLVTSLWRWSKPRHSSSWWPPFIPPPALSCTLPLCLTLTTLFPESSFPFNSPLLPGFAPTSPLFSSFISPYIGRRVLTRNVFCPFPPKVLPNLLRSSSTLFFAQRALSKLFQ